MYLFVAKSFYICRNMAYVPDIIDLQPFYIQTKADTVARSTTEWGLVPKTNPYPILPTPKEVYKNDWKDENGEEEYTDEMFYQSMEMSVDFYVKAFDEGDVTAHEQIRSQIDAFFNLISKGEFKVYDSYTGLGRKKVRYAGYSEGTYKSRSVGKGWASVVFTIKFKINDPITRVVLSGNQLIEQ